MSARISWLDVKLGLRMLIKHPAMTIVGGLGMAVAIAISVGFFSFMLMYGWPELPLEEGERVVALENRDVALDNEDQRALHDFFTWREELRSVQDVGAFRTVQRNLITGDGPPELVFVAEMTAAGFRVTRVPPLLGRYLIEEDESTTATPVVVIGYDVWRNRFASDSAVVGRTLRLGGTVRTIVGVMPEGYAFPENHRIWTPLRVNLTAFPRRQGPEIFIFGRLAPGITMKQAQSELESLGARAAAAFPETHAQLRPMVMPYTHSLSDIQGITRWALAQMQLMTNLLLLVVALNVAVLIYARTATRQSEIAVRTALGASRTRVVAQLFAEALVLSSVAAAVGLLLAQFGLALGNRIIETEWDFGTPFWMDHSIRPGTILLTIGLAVFAAIIVGILPGLQATGRRLQSDLRQLGGTTNVRLGRTWTALIVVQIAIAVAALPAAVALGWDALRKAATQALYPAEEFLVASITPEADLADTTQIDGAPTGNSRFTNRLSELMRRLEAEPAVAGVSFRAFLPGRGSLIRVEGLPAPAESPGGHFVDAAGVHPGYSELFGARMVSGRSFTAADAGDAATAVIVNQAFVRDVLGGGSALGRRIRHVSEQERTGSTQAAPERWYEIVGVVQDLYRNTAAPDQVTPELTYPVATSQLERASLTVRLRESTPADFGPRLREIAGAVDPALRVGTVFSLADNDRQERMAARLIGLATGLVLLSVLLLSAAGIYALMSFTVTQRRREIGIRSALGALPRQVLGSVFARAAWQIALGVAVGIVLAVPFERLMGNNTLTRGGIVVIPLIALVMAVVGLCAALGPVRRGLKIQPQEALRADG